MMVPRLRERAVNPRNCETGLSGFTLTTRSRSGTPFFHLDLRSIQLRPFFPLISGRTSGQSRAGCRVTSTAHSKTRSIVS